MRRGEVAGSYRGGSRSGQLVERLADSPSSRIVDMAMHMVCRDVIFRAFEHVAQPIVATAVHRRKAGAVSLEYLSKHGAVARVADQADRAEPRGTLALRRADLGARPTPRDDDAVPAQTGKRFSHDRSRRRRLSRQSVFPGQARIHCACAADDGIDCRSVGEVAPVRNRLGHHRRPKRDRRTSCPFARSAQRTPGEVDLQ